MIHILVPFTSILIVIADSSRFTFTRVQFTEIIPCFGTLLHDYTLIGAEIVKVVNKNYNRWFSQFLHIDS